MSDSARDPHSQHIEAREFSGNHPRTIGGHSQFFETQRVSGITRGLSAARGRNRPTIGLSEIGSVARVRGAVRAATELETWNAGIRAARREVGRRGAAVARSARVGRARAAAMASPMGRRRASQVPRGTRLRSMPARVLANACSTGNRSQVVGALNRSFIGAT